MGQTDGRPWGKLTVSVFAEHIAGDRLVVDAGLAGQRAEKPRRVESGAGAEYAPSRKPESQSKLVRYNVAGIGDIDNNAVKTAFPDFPGKAAHRRDREVHLRGAVVRFAEKLNLSHAVDDHVAFAEIGKLSGTKDNAVRQIRRGVAQVLYLACELPRIFIDEYQLVRNALHRERISDMRADVPQTDHAEDPLFCHGRTHPFAAK